MRRTCKPVHDCHPCLLNLGDRCWLFESPHHQWHDKGCCSAFENEVAYAQYRAWLEEPHEPTRKEQRRKLYESLRRTEEHHNHFASGVGPLA